jgi:putative peptide-modifying radical SAM enzyme
MKEFDNELDKKFKFDFTQPAKTEINIQKLKNFISKDPKAVIVFYGGEPLLEIEKIKEIMDNINVPFRMQSNGKLLNELPIEYVKRISKMLISLDGDKKITDFNRGKGTYDRVIANITLIRSQGYNGEIIARMTISQNQSNVFKQVKYLVENGFDAIHWQLDAGFYKFDFNKERYEKFVEKYNNSITKLINYWVKQMKTGKVLKLYPLLAIIESLLKNEPTKLRCGSGHSGYSITTNGKIVACPIMNSIKDFEAGDLDSNPDELKKFDVSEPCTNCSYLSLCGGRCLYWNKSKLWPAEGDELICKTIKHLIDSLKNKMPEIKKLIKKGVISENDFEYEKYFGPEIIP